MFKISGTLLLEIKHAKELMEEEDEEKNEEKKEEGREVEEGGRG